MEFPYAEMHAFPDGDAPHSGNPAGVVILHRDLSDADLLGVAQSNNLSETAYLKANYPEEFIAASMALDAGSTDDRFC